MTEWSDRFLYLPRETSAEPGKFSSTRIPWCKGMLDPITDTTIREHIWCFGSQLIKTTGAIAVVGYYAQHEPSPILVKYPTQASSKSFSQEKLEPTIRETPVLHRCIAEAKSRDSKNTIFFKKFAGGFLAMIGANSPSELRRRSCRVVIQDEIDSDRPSAGQEGDPVSLADKRAITFGNRVLLKMSSPGARALSKTGEEHAIFETGPSRIYELFKKSDMCFFFVPCVHCQKEQRLVWEQVKWTKDGDGSDATYQCVHCDEHWNDTDRIQSIYKGRWKATAKFTGRRGLFLNGIYRIVGNDQGNYLSEFVKEYLEAKESEETYKVWFNTFLALPYEIKVTQIDPRILIKRAERYGPLIPNSVNSLFSAVDVQDDRIEVDLVGIGANEHSWSIHYQIMMGSVREGVLDEFYDWFRQPKQRADGSEMLIGAAAIDTGGHFTKEVYDFCKDKVNSRICAVKGRGGAGVPTVTRPKFHPEHGIWLYTLGVDALKAKIYYQLGAKTPISKGYCHFPIGHGYNEEYYKGLTSEVVKKRIRGGREERYFYQPPGVPNEPLDCRAYILAMIGLFSRRLQQLGGSYFVPSPDAPPVDPASTQAPPTDLEYPEDAQTVQVEMPSRTFKKPKQKGWVHRKPY